MLLLVSKSSRVRSSVLSVDQVWAKRTATAHTFTYLSESVASQQWVLETLTTKRLEAHLQVLFLPHLLHRLSQVLHRLKDQEPTQARCLDEASQQVQMFFTYKTS
jgi:hypothetical protein